MTLILTSIANTIGKIIYPLAYFLNLSEVVETSVTTNESFLDSLLNHIPATVLTVLAIAYGCLLLFQRGLKAYKQYRLDQIEIKKSQEDLERDEMETKLKKEKISNENH